MDFQMQYSRNSPSISRTFGRKNEIPIDRCQYRSAFAHRM
jgi:hypothetical protein